VLKTYGQLEKLRDAGGPHADLVASYLSETQEHITVIVNSLYNIRDLDPSAEMKMDRLREELRALTENEIKIRLKSVNYKIDYSVLAAVTGSERIEAVW
jgi:phosphoribosylamine-glycine ligase